jgi:tripartite-type tricarboxylate transporter receptor subunit TctC
MHRTVALCLALFAASVSGSALGQAWPSKNVRIVITISPGSTADILGRVVAEPLTKQLGQTFVVENRPGAGGSIAAEIVAKSPPDGYTLLLASISTHGINPGLYRKLPYEPMRDFEPITAMAQVPNTLIVSPSLPVKSVADLVRLAKGKPGEISFSSGGNGTSHHLAGELFNTMAGIKTSHIPYRGTPEAVTAVARGEAIMMFPNAPNAMELAKGGKLRALAMTSAKRVSWWSELPTMLELGYPGFEVSAWFGMMAPAGTPEPIVRRLHGEIQKALELPNVKEALVRQGFEMMGGTPDDFRKFMRAEMDKWARVVKLSGAAVN